MAPDLVPRVVARLAALLPVYTTLPREALDGDITRVVERGIRDFGEVLSTGRLPGPEQLDAVRESAARRAEEGLPLEAVVSAYFMGAQECTAAVSSAAEPADLPAVVAVNQLLLEYLRLVTQAVSAGFFHEHRAAFGEEHSARQALLAALLDGGPVRQAAERAGLAVPDCYLVLSVAIGRHPDENAPGVDPVVAARRKLRRLRREFDRQAREPVLTDLTADGGLVLVPSQVAATKWRAEHWERLSAGIVQLGRMCGADLTVGAEPAPAEGVPQAARLAAEVRTVAAVFSRGPGLYRLSDVLVEYQLTRPTPARDRLAVLLCPLAERPEMLQTLRVFLANGLDRRRTAAQLLIHPNTVDYRLRRTGELTGLDVGRGEDLPTLYAALAAHDIAAGDDTRRA
ncbi:PucR family transcriptional regulator [Streptomyces similanensis]